MNPFCIPFAITNMGGALVAMDLKFMGPNYSIAAACATGNFCMMNAVDHIRNGECDLCLAGASDAAVLSSGIAGFAASKALSTRNDDPEGASRPWDKNRDGFVMGEGCGVLCLESLESALARDAPILAEILGGAATCDAHHMTEPLPNGNGVRLAINRALKNAGVLAEDVNYINAHATSTPAGDLAELRTITDIFGENKELKINSTKSLIGHLLGAASAVEAVAVIKAIGTGELHPNKNLEDPDEGVRTDLLVGTTKEKLRVNVALSNSFGFGGHNSAVLFSAYDLKADTFARAASGERKTRKKKYKADFLIKIRYNYTLCHAIYSTYSLSCCCCCCRRPCPRCRVFKLLFLFCSSSFDACTSRGTNPNSVS